MDPVDTDLILQLVAHHSFTNPQQWKDFLDLSLLSRKFHKFINLQKPQKVKDMKLMDEFLSSFDRVKAYPVTTIVKDPMSIMEKSRGFTKLMFLIINEKKTKHDFIQEYIQNHLDEIDLQNSKGLSALMISAWNSNDMSSLKTVKQLLKVGADVNLVNKSGNAAMDSNSTSSIETVKTLLKAGANVNHQNSARSTALHFACQNSGEKSSEETVRVLLETPGINVDLTDFFGWTSLLWASRYSNSGSTVFTVKMLLYAGANINFQDPNGYTALMLASIFSQEGSSLETVKVLLEAGANINLRNVDGKTALELALEYSKNTSCQETVDLLKKWS